MTTTFSRLSQIAFFAVLGVAYLFIYGETWLDMERVWRSSATYNHCYLILPICLYFFYRQHNAPRSATMSSLWLWLPSVSMLLLSLLWLFGFAADIALFTHVAAVMTLQALLWLILGNARSRQHLFAIGYLIFLVPFGEELSPFLQNITADLTVMMLQLVNIPVYREGLYLATPVGLFEVAEACSGLRFLIASLAISVLFSHLHYNKLWKQISFVAFMAVLSILANGVRAFMLVYIGEKTNMQFGFGADHYLYGWLFFGLVLIAGFWLGARFSDPLPDTGADNDVRPALATNRLLLPHVIAAIALITVSGYRLSLQLVTPPATAAAISLPFATPTSETSNWGISFIDSLAQAHAADAAGVEYFTARYANKQRQGELINWQNTLYDKQRWQVQQRQTSAHYTLLQLADLSGRRRTILYWYQVGERRVTSAIETKLRQALTYLADDSSSSAIFAVSASGGISEQNLVLLQQAATLLAQAEQPTLPSAAGSSHD